MQALSSSFCGEAVRVATAASPSSTSQQQPQRLPTRCGESRIGKMPVVIPKGVTTAASGQTLTVKGPLGELSRTFPDLISIVVESDAIKVTKKTENRKSRELHGLCRTLASNMVNGVATGWTKKLVMTGVGYRASVQGTELVMNLGYSHPIKMTPPSGVSVKVEDNVNVFVTGRDREVVGNFAAIIRSKRPPEPYKGKGVAYSDEKILRKEGKTGKGKK
eukprot:jgi/Chlat1/293/Chrsp1S03164